MESSSTSGLSNNQKDIYNRFKNVSKSTCGKCGGTNTIPAAYGDPESDYKAVETKTGVLKYGGKTKASKNTYCKSCSAFV
jgi:hypothetical protein